MRYPKKLEKGDTIGIICASSSIKTERIEECRKAIEDLGYKVKMADNLDVNPYQFIAGSGKVRAEWVNKMFADPEVDAIICARGGDGSGRIMPYLDLELIKNNPKIFVGYSDMTNMLTTLNQDCDMVAFHGPMISSNIVDDFDEETKASFFQAVNAEGTYEFKNPEGYELEVFREGIAEGTLTGGNLCLITHSLGTYYEVDFTDKIVFIEEITESLASCERAMTQLLNSGKLAKAKAILFGQYTYSDVSEDPRYETIEDYLKTSGLLDGLDMPIIFNVQSGHGFPMMTLPMGAYCKVDTRTKSITFEGR